MKIRAAMILFVSLGACAGLPETAAGVEKPVTYEGADYMVRFSVSEVSEDLPPPGSGSVRFDASFIEISPVTGAVDDRSEARAIATAFCQAYGVPVAPAPGVVSELSGGRWLVRNHCASFFG